MSIRNKQLISLLLACCLAASSLSGCFAKKPAVEPEPAPPVESKPENNSGWGNSTPGKPSTPSTPSVSTTVETKRIGDDERGYVDIPKGWVIFLDYDPMPGVIQYSDPLGINIITLNVFDDTDPYSICAAYGMSYEKKDGVNVTYARVTLKNLPDTVVYQMYCYLPQEGIYFIIYTFAGPSGKTNYVAIEGNLDDIAAVVILFESSFSFDPE